jgi:hypothetical protein
MVAYFSTQFCFDSTKAASIYQKHKVHLWSAFQPTFRPKKRIIEMKGNVQKGTMILTLWGGEGQSVPIGFRLAATSHRIMQWLQKFLTLSKFSKIRVLKIHYFHLLRKKIPQIEI